MTKYYALIGPKLDGPALNPAMTACSIEPSIRQVPRLYVNRMVSAVQWCRKPRVGTRIRVEVETRIGSKRAIEQPAQTIR